MHSSSLMRLSIKFSGSLLITQNLVEGDMCVKSPGDVHDGCVKSINYVSAVQYLTCCLSIQGTIVHRETTAARVQRSLKLSAIHVFQNVQLACSRIIKLCRQQLWHPGHMCFMDGDLSISPTRRS